MVTFLDANLVIPGVPDLQTEAMLKLMAIIKSRAWGKGGGLPVLPYEEWVLGSATLLWAGTRVL